MVNNLSNAFIEALPPEVIRPTWSVMIPTYNGTKYLRETLQSVLVQDPGADEMQIEVIDDASTTDNPKQLVDDIGKGRISFFRQDNNQGQIKTWNNCIRRAQGHWIHILHQDDVVLPNFYECLRSAITTEQVGSAFCRNIYMDEDGHWQNFSPIEQKTPGILEDWSDRISISQRVQCPSIIVRRSTYEKIGGFCPEAHSAADWEMWKRISVHYPVWYEPKPLACFRLHSGSETSRLVKSGKNIVHARKAIEISKAYLPESKRERISKQAKKKYAFYALKIAHQLLLEKDTTAAIAQIREALKCRFSPSTLWFLVRIITKASLRHMVLPIKYGG